MQAAYDPLTGLWNRKAILKYLGREVERTRRQNGVLGVLIAQIDQLEEINAQYGLSVGNQIIGEAARRLRAAIRIYDEIGHYSGEQMLLVLDLSKATPTHYSHIGERLRLSVSQKPIETSAGELSVTVSLGLAVSTEQKRLPPDALLATAREAIRHARLAGGKPTRNHRVARPCRSFSNANGANGANGAAQSRRPQRASNAARSASLVTRSRAGKKMLCSRW